MKLKSLFLPALILLALCLIQGSIHFSPASAGGPWYVAPGGDDSNDCLSAGSACSTINGALGKSGFVGGDTILVAAGTYTGTGTEVVLIDKDATLSGGWDGTFSTLNGFTVIDGDGSVRGMSVNSGVTATVERFSIQNSYRGVYNYYGTLTLNNCAVRDNVVSGDGGGIENYYGSLTLNNSSVTNNRPDVGGGGIKSYRGSIVLNNSTISGNSGSSGGGIKLRYTDNLYVNNSTISGNTAIFDGGGILSENSTVTMRNSIVAGNTANNDPDCSGTIGSAGYNLIGDITGCTFIPSTGDLTDTDPSLGQIIGHPGYHPLLAGSPAINAGNPAGCEDHLGNPLNTDLRGVSRVGICDIGAYEYTTPGAAASIFTRLGTPQHSPPLTAFDTQLSVEVLDSNGSPVNGATVTYTAPDSGASGTFVDSATYITTASTGMDGIATAAVFTSNAQFGSYSVTASVDGVPDPASFQLENILWYVSVSGDDGNSCQDSGSPCATITGVFAKDDFFEGDTALVSADTFTGTGDQVVRLTRDVILSGGWDGSFTTQNGNTIIDGEDSRRCFVVNSGVNAEMEFFIFQNGYADWPRGGGGIENVGTLKVDNSIIRDNRADDDGGGIYNNYGTLTLNNSTVVGNRASEDGGGIYNTDGIVNLVNSTISGNRTGRWGGGIKEYSATVNLYNSTISGNRANSTGGGFDGTVFSQNSIIAGNTADIFGQDCSGTINSSGYNLIGDTGSCTFTPTTGDLSNVDPNLGQLIGAPGQPMYHPLISGSIAIDAGNPSGCKDDLDNLLPTDQRGVSRVGRCDIGAYEYIAPGPAAVLYALSGSPQSTPPYSTFEDPLIVVVLDNIGSPVRDVVVNYSAPASGASGTFVDSGTFTTTAMSNENGAATSASFSANALEGTYTVNATASGVGTTAEFLLTNGGGWFVSTSGSDTNDCQSASDPCASINGPLAKPGFTANNTVLVAAGTYTGSGNEVVLLDKSVRILGGWNAVFTTQSGTSTIDGEGARRGITANSGITVIIDEFTIQNGSTGDGGGIHNQATLTINSSTIRDNTATTDGGGILNLSSTLTLNDSTISGNSGDSGGGIFNNSGFLTLNDSIVDGNTAGWRGGAIVIFGSSNVTLNNSTVSNNTAGYAGGILNRSTLFLNSTTVSGNNDTGITNWGGNATITNSTVSGNSASYGGGISNDGTLTLNRSTMSGNSANNDGGAIYNRYNSTVYVNNSTISANTADYDGGAVYNYTDATLNLNSSTIVGNTADHYGGGICDGGSSSTELIENSILYGNSASNSGPDCYGTLETSGYNFIGSTSDCTFTPAIGDLIGVDPRFGPLQDNGGPTYTHALPIYSSAIDEGNPGGCLDHTGAPLLTDQRGLSRFQTCDVGAYEFQGNVSRVFLPSLNRYYCHPLYQDYFQDPGSGWPIANTGSVLLEYLNGEYRIFVRTINYWAGASPGYKASDYIAAVDVRNETGDYGSYGLIFGISDDWGQFYSFEIDTVGNYAVFRFNTGTWTLLADGFSAQIRTGTASNWLKVVREGSSLKAYANDALLADLSDNTYTGLRRVGLITTSYNISAVDARFDNFIIFPIYCDGSGASTLLHDDPFYMGSEEMRDAWTSGPSSKEGWTGE